jgi:hypothetical protein
MVPSELPFIGGQHHLSQDSIRTRFSYQHGRHVEKDSFAYWWADPHKQRMEGIFLKVRFESVY